MIIGENSGVDYYQDLKNTLLGTSVVRRNLRHIVLILGV